MPDRVFHIRATKQKSATYAEKDEVVEKRYEAARETGTMTRVPSCYSKATQKRADKFYDIVQHQKGAERMRARLKAKLEAKKQTPP